MPSANPKEFPRAQVTRLADLVAYQDAAVVSRQILKTPTASVTFFAFDQGEGLTEHTTPFDAIAQIVEGAVEITISGHPHHLQSGDVILMPANQPHALKALERFKMMLTMVRP